MGKDKMARWESQYLVIEKGMTPDIWLVYARSSNDLLATVERDPKWKCLVLSPCSATVWSVECLEAIVRFIKEQEK
jgi:hypothetical protein